MSYCTNCGKKVEEEYNFCPECGLDLRNETAYESADEDALKPKSGERILTDASYCLDYRLNRDNEKDNFDYIQKRVGYQFGTWKNKWIALLLCIFLGWLGGHKYYEEKIGQGIIYTLTGGLFGIGWIVDIILLVLKPDPYLAKK